MQIGTRLIYAIYAYLSNKKSTYRAYIQFPGIELISAAYMHQSDKRLLPVTYTIPTFENLLSAISFGICFRADVLFKAKKKTFPTMLKSLTPENYSSNIGISGIVRNSD